MRINIQDTLIFSLVALTALSMQMPLRVPILGTELTWPNFWVFPLAATALLTTRLRVSFIALSHIFAYLGVLLLSTQLGHQNLIGTSERLKSIPLAITYFSTFLLLAELRYSSLNREKLGRYFHIAASLILLFSITEIFFLPAKELSNSIREFLYGNFYASDERDLSFAGFIRPKAFAYEPSFNAFTITALSILGGFYLNNRKGHIKSLVLCALTFAIVASPLVVALTGFYALSKFHVFFPKLKKGFTSIVFAGITLSLVGAILVNFHEPTKSRIDNILTGLDGSIKMRTVNQAIFAAESLRLSPFFGVGIGGEGEIEYKIRELYLFEWPGGNFAQTCMLSPLFSLITFTGLSGLLWLLWSQMSLSRNCLPQYYQSYLILAFGFLLFSGSIITTNVWIFLGLVLSYARKQTETSAITNEHLR